MRPNATLDRTVEGNLNGVRHKMGIDSNSIAHIMSILTDLYSDPETAVIREYSCNAWDSHVEAGQKRPIEISLPGTLAPYFKVKDYGVGLSVDEISQVYSQYGASTKRDTNDQVGMLGLGSKSALTYTQQFTVTSVKNGVKIVVAVSRIEDGTGVMEVVDTSATDEPNGVEIMVPVKRDNNFESKARDFFKYWDKDKVLINGKAPENFRDNATPVGTKFYNVPRDRAYGDFKDRVLMGSVSYPVADGLWNVAHNNFYIVAVVPIGSVSITPSREALLNSPTTTATLNALRDEYNNTVVASAKVDIESSKSKPEAMNKWLGWESMLGRGVVPKEYKGQPIITNWNVKSFQWNRHRSRNAVGAYTNYNINSQSQLDEVMFIKNYTRDDYPVSGHKAKVKYYWEQKHPGTEAPKYIFFTNADFSDGWIDPAKFVDWDDIRIIKLNQVPTMNRRTYAPREEAYDAMLPGKHGVTEISNLDTSLPIWYYSSADEYSAAIVSYARDVDKDNTVVVLNRNRHDKFQRDWPTAKPVGKGLVEAAAKKGKALITEVETLQWNIEQNRSGWFSLLDPAKILDPELKKWILEKKSPRASNIQKMHSIQWLVRYATSQQFNPPTLPNPLIHYPLTRLGTDRSLVTDMTNYINAIYKTKGN